MATPLAGNSIPRLSSSLAGLAQIVRQASNGCVMCQLSETYICKLADLLQPYIRLVLLTRELTFNTYFEPHNTFLPEGIVG